VILANSRNEGSVRDPNEDTKMRRLFIIVPKSYSEENVRKDFEVLSTLSVLELYSVFEVDTPTICGVTGELLHIVEVLSENYVGILTITGRYLSKPYLLKFVKILH